MPILVKTQIRSPAEKGSPPMPPINLTDDDDEEAGS